MRKQLLQFCFTSDERSTQVGFVEQQFRIQLLRHLRRLAGDGTGAVVIAGAADPGTGFNPDRLADREPQEAAAGEGHVIRGFGDFVAEAVTQSRIAATEARQASVGARQLADQARTHGDDALKELTDTAAAIAEPFRLALKLPPDATELEGVDTAPAADCIKAAKEQDQVLEARQKQRMQFQQALDQASREREALALRRRDKVEAPIGKVGADLNRERDALAEAAFALNAGDDRVPGPVPASPPAVVSAWAAQLRDATAAMLDVADRTKKAALADAEATRTSLIELGRRLADADAVAEATQAGPPAIPTM